MARNVAEAVNSYVTDMVSLEEHIQKAFQGQVSDLKDDYPEFVRYLKRVLLQIDTHIETLKALVDRRVNAGQGLADVIKRAGSALAGAGASAIDFARTEKLPKNLRDDFTALNLASIGYVMLHTTALSLGDDEVANLAQRHLADHARNVMELHNIVPSAVIAFLQEEGLPARAEVLPEVSRNVEAIWSDQSRSVPSVAEAAGGSAGTVAVENQLADRPITNPT